MVVKTTFNLNVLHLCMQTNWCNNMKKSPHRLSIWARMLEWLREKQHHTPCDSCIYFPKNMKIKKKHWCCTAFRTTSRTSSKAKSGRILFEHFSNFVYHVLFSKFIHHVHFCYLLFTIHPRLHQPFYRYTDKFAMNTTIPGWEKRDLIIAKKGEKKIQNITFHLPTE